MSYHYSSSHGGSAGTRTRVRHPADMRRSASSRPIRPTTQGGITSFFGSRARTRTGDALLRTQALCPLSYAALSGEPVPRPEVFYPHPPSLEPQQRIELWHGRYKGPLATHAQRLMDEECPGPLESCPVLLALLRCSRDFTQDLVADAGVEPTIARLWAWHGIRATHPRWYPWQDSNPLPLA